VPRKKPVAGCWKQFKQGVMLEVTWIDAMASAEWTDVESLKKKEPDLLCKTVGYFLYQTDAYVCLAATLGAVKGDEANGVMYIPKDWTQKVKRLPSA